MFANSRCVKLQLRAMRLSPNSQAIHVSSNTTNGLLLYLTNHVSKILTMNQNTF